MTFLENLEWRYATKNFSGKQIEGEVVEKILKAIQFAPSSFGAQPYHVYVISDKDLLSKLKLHAKDNEKKFDTCSHMFVFCARTDVKNRFEGIERLQQRTDGTLSRIGFYLEYFFSAVFLIILGQLSNKVTWTKNQTYLAAGFALAACAELQVDACPMEGFNSLSFKKILNMPKGFHPSVLMAIGQRDPNDKIYPKRRYSKEDLFTFM